MDTRGYRSKSEGLSKFFSRGVTVYRMVVSAVTCRLYAVRLTQARRGLNVVGVPLDYEVLCMNQGFEWSPDKPYGRSRLWLCFANPSHAAIRAGVPALVEVCRREFGVPARIANVEQRAARGT